MLTSAVNDCYFRMEMILFSIDVGLRVHAFDGFAEAVDEIQLLCLGGGFACFYRAAFLGCGGSYVLAVGCFRTLSASILLLLITPLFHSRVRAV